MQKGHKTEVKSPGHREYTQLLDVPQSEGIGAAEMEKTTGVSELGNKNGYLPIKEFPSTGKSGRSSMVIF